MFFRRLALFDPDEANVSMRFFKVDYLTQSVGKSISFSESPAGSGNFWDCKIHGTLMKKFVSLCHLEFCSVYILQGSRSG